MKKLILISLLTVGSSLFAAADIGIKIQTPIGNNAVLDIGFKSDDHRYDNRYKNFDYNRNGYRDNFGYFYGYFDKVGYFYNNIFFTYDSRYTYSDRLHHRGYFKPSAVHYRTYKYHNNNDWNKVHNYREVNKPIYGAYYDKSNNKQKVVVKQYNNKQQNIKQQNQNIKQQNQNLKQQNQNLKQQNQNIKQQNQNIKQQNQNIKQNNQYIKQQNQNHR